MAARSLNSLIEQVDSVDEHLTGRENLMLLGRVLGLSCDHCRRRADELIESSGLGGEADRLVRDYSDRTRRRFERAALLVVVPDVLFLEQPDTELSSDLRRRGWQVVRALAEEGTAILVSSDHSEEAAVSRAESLADR
jgi:ABC-2 type transport system ATP-binding protein